jgi:hypothetical protein
VVAALLLINISLNNFKNTSTLKSKFQVTTTYVCTYAHILSDFYDLDDRPDPTDAGVLLSSVLFGKSVGTFYRSV